MASLGTFAALTDSNVKFSDLHSSSKETVPGIILVAAHFNATTIPKVTSTLLLPCRHTCSLFSVKPCPH